MKDLHKIGFLALALVASTFAWICLAFAGAGSGSDEHAAEVLGDILVFLAAGYGLLTIALALRAFDRFEPLDGKALRITLSVAGFFAALPLGITFELGDAPAAVTACSCGLALLPWLVPLRHHGVDPEA